jgi:hypothetical protein
MSTKDLMEASFYRRWVLTVGGFMKAQIQAGTPGFTGRCRLEPVLTVVEVAKLQEAVQIALPQCLLDFFVTGAGGCSFRYNWDQSLRKSSAKELPTWVDERIHGGTELCIADNLGGWMRECRAWATDTWIAEEPEQQQLWMRSVPIAELENGDYLGLFTPEDGIEPQVVYLSHEDISQVVAPSFRSFLSEWERICYLGPEIWVLDQFLDTRTGHLISGTDKGQDVRSLFSLSYQNGLSDKCDSD